MPSPIKVFAAHVEVRLILQLGMCVAVSNVLERSLLLPEVKKAVAICPVIAQGFQNTKWPAVLCSQ